MVNYPMVILLKAVVFFIGVVDAIHLSACFETSFTYVSMIYLGELFDCNIL